MGKRLKNPPLISVTSRLWWHIQSSQEMESLKPLSGLLYSRIADDFPFSIDTSVSTSPFKTAFANNEKYELIAETDLNEFLIISTDSNYEWLSYSNQVKKAFPHALEILKDRIDPHHLHLSLEYLDFFALEEHGYKDDMNRFLSELLGVRFSIPEFENDFKKFDFEISKNEGGNGSMTVRVYNGKKPDGTEGIFIKFSFGSEKLEPRSIDLNNWFEISHEYCRKYFHSFISGKIKDNLKYEE